MSAIPTEGPIPRPSRLDRWSAGWRGPLVAAVLVLVSALPGLCFLPPLDRDESRFAQATAQMLETGDYVNIRYQGEPRDKKPVGIHWLQAASVSVFLRSKSAKSGPTAYPRRSGRCWRRRPAPGARPAS